MVAQRIAETNMFATDYLELLNELMNLTERRLAKDEVIKAISEKIPPTIARQLAESSTLKAADNHISAETALKLEKRVAYLIDTGSQIRIRCRSRDDNTIIAQAKACNKNEEQIEIH